MKCSRCCPGTGQPAHPPRSPAKRLSRRISSGANRQLKSSPVAAAALTSYHKVLLIKLGPHVDNIKSCLEAKPCPLGHDRFIRPGAQSLRRRGTASVELAHQGSRRYSRLYLDIGPAIVGNDGDGIASAAV